MIEHSEFRTEMVGLVRCPANPKPGTPEAVDAGCHCPIFDNSGGAGYLGLGTKAGWWVAAGCPVRDAAEHGRRQEGK